MSLVLLRVCTFENTCPTPPFPGHNAGKGVREEPDDCVVLHQNGIKFSDILLKKHIFEYFCKMLYSMQVVLREENYSSISNVSCRWLLFRFAKTVPTPDPVPTPVTNFHKT